MQKIEEYIKIAEDHSVAGNQTKNVYIQLYLTCYNESEKGLFYMKLLKVGRLTNARLITL